MAKRTFASVMSLIKVFAMEDHTFIPDFIYLAAFANPVSFLKTSAMKLH